MVGIMSLFKAPRNRFFGTITFPALAAVLLTWGNAGSGADAVILTDNFSDPKFSQRKAMRGDWSFGEEGATVTQNDELYRQYKDHGPILIYDLPLVDAEVNFRFKAENAKTVVFTANGEAGHIFRFVLSEAGLSVRAFPPDSESKSIALGMEKDLPLKANEWTKVTVVLKGSTARIQIGDTFDKIFEHPSYAAPKTNISVGFSFGTLTVADLVVKG